MSSNLVSNLVSSSDKTIKILRDHISNNVSKLTKTNNNASVDKPNFTELLKKEILNQNNS